MLDQQTARRLPQNDEELALYDEKDVSEARRVFPAFRRLIRPKMAWGWWVEMLAWELQAFYLDLLDGKRPKLAIMAPPQHGKSWMATDFIAWVSGKNPNLKTIFASYSDSLGHRTNRDLARVFTSERFKMVFPWLRIGEELGWAFTQSLIEFPDYAGSFRNTTVEGKINGMELNLGVIDDPVKGRLEASSKANRDLVWNWFADDWGARFAENSAMLIVMTRWHVDDLLGRFLERESDLKQIAYPAIAEKDEYAPDGKLRRRRGAPLFPEVKSLKFLNERRKIMTTGSWESEYQQHPIIVGGGLLPIDKLMTMPFWNGQGIKASCRFWDKAGTENKGAYSAGVLMHAMKDGTYVISHVARGQWSALERERMIKRCTEQDTQMYENYEVGIEQEPGSGGKESAEASVRNLAGFRVFIDRVTGSKEVRASPFAAQVQGGNVRLVAGDWVIAYRDECETFPNGKFKDQVDASSGAFNHLVKALTFDTSYDWVE